LPAVRRLGQQRSSLRFDRPPVTVTTIVTIISIEDRDHNTGGSNQLVDEAILQLEDRPA
jgi:hypothetical protein